MDTTIRLLGKVFRQTIAKLLSWSTPDFMIGRRAFTTVPASMSGSSVAGGEGQPGKEAGACVVCCHPPGFAPGHDQIPPFIPGGVCSAPQHLPTRWVRLCRPLFSKRARVLGRPRVPALQIPSGGTGLHPPPLGCTWLWLVGLNRIALVGFSWYVRPTDEARGEGTHALRSCCPGWPAGWQPGGRLGLVRRVHPPALARPVTQNLP